jgi:hypothetical protein
MKTQVVVGLFLGMFGAHAAADPTELFQARLTGDQEVPPVVTDTTGRFELLLDKSVTSGEYTLRVESGVRVTQSHFHCGPAGVNGPVIVFLAGFHANGWDVDGKWVSNATITDANIVNTACGATLAAIAEAARNGNVYVNVHSVAVPSGVVRGQLEPADKD